MPDNDLMVTAGQFGAVLLADDKRYIHRLQIRSASTRNLYIVSWDTATEAWACSCMGWVRHRRCRHLTAMVPTLEAARKRIAIARAG